MARIRTIKPEFWSDEEIGELSTNARLLFIATWNICDDEGLLKWSPAFLKAQAFAYDDVTKADVESFMDELTDLGFIFPYKDGKGKPYGWIVNFRKHQKIDRAQPAKHPLPSLQNPAIRARIADRDGWVCHLCGEEIEHPTDDGARRLSVDHVTPKSKGGSDAPSNIKAAHFGCNASKKDKVIDELSTNVRGPVNEGSTQEGKGSRNKEISPTPARTREHPDDLIPVDWQPDQRCVDRLRMSGINDPPSQSQIQSFIAHYRGVERHVSNAGQITEWFVKWMIGDKVREVERGTGQQTRKLSAVERNEESIRRAAAAGYLRD